MRCLVLCAFALSACSTPRSAPPPPRTAEHSAPSIAACVARWAALDDERRDALLELAFSALGQYEVEFERAQRIADRWLDLESRPASLTARSFDALDRAHLRLNDPGLRELLSRNTELWREGHPRASPESAAQLHQRITRLASLEHFDGGAHALAGHDFDACAAFAALFDARLAQLEYEREHPPPRPAFCLLPEDWAAIQAHPFVNRRAVALGPRLAPAVHEFLEQIERALSR